MHAGLNRLVHRDVIFTFHWNIKLLTANIWQEVATRSYRAMESVETHDATSRCTQRQDRQCTYNVTSRRAHETTVAVEKEVLYY